MKGSTKSLCRVMALLLAVTSCMGFISCAKGPGKGNTTPQTTPIEDLDFKGETFTIHSSINVLTGESLDSYKSSNYLIQGAEEVLGDKASDSALQRNALVQEELNVKFNYIESDFTYNEVFSSIRDLVKSGADGIHLIINDMRLIGLSTEGIFHDASYGAYFDFEQNYWYDDLMESIALKSGTRYAIAGDYFIDVIRFTDCLIMNKDLYGIFGCDPESIYDVVRNQEWTLDKFYEILVGGEGYPYSSTYIDLTGNRKRDTRDTYGFISWDYWGPMQGFLTGADPGYITRDENGYPVINVYNEKTLAMQEDLIKIFNANETGVGRLYNNESAKASKAFFEGRGLFFGGQTLGALEAAEFAASDINFAVLPFPKLDETQPNYISTVHDIAEMGFIPSTISFGDLDLVSAVVECLSRETAKTVIPKYYESTLKVRYSRESANAEMIDILHYNYGGAFALAWSYYVEGFFFNPIIDSVTSNQDNFASYYRSYENSAHVALADLITAHENVREELEKQYSGGTGK